VSLTPNILRQHRMLDQYFGADENQAQATECLGGAAKPFADDTSQHDLDRSHCVKVASRLRALSQRSARRETPTPAAFIARDTRAVERKMGGGEATAIAIKRPS
jgi:hypothetical protein